MIELSASILPVIQQQQQQQPVTASPRPFSAPNAASHSGGGHLHTSSLSQKRPSAKSLSLKIGSLDEIRIPGLDLESIRADANSKSSSQASLNLHFTMDSLDFVRILGAGSNGSVALCMHKATRTLMAKKTIPVFTASSDQEGGIVTRTQILRELRILRNCAHPNIVEFYGAFLYCGELSIMMEYMDLGSLESIYKKFGAISSEVLVAGISFQLLQGLQYLHEEMHVIHRDIKPQNMLLNSSGFVKISDFGISKEFEFGKAGPSSFVGTIIYLSPEILQRKDETSSQPNTSSISLGDGDSNHSMLPPLPSAASSSAPPPLQSLSSSPIYQLPYVSDIWSFGLSIMEIATATFPYPAETFSSSFDIVPLLLEEPSPTLNSSFSASFQEFISLCLRKDPKERPSASVLLKESDFILQAKRDGHKALEEWAKNLSSKLRL